MLESDSQDSWRMIVDTCPDHHDHPKSSRDDSEPVWSTYYYSIEI
jgi:hypothetical protein